MHKNPCRETKAPFYYSLLGAVNHFGLTPNEIIDMAITGEIVLSIKIPKGYSPYLLSVTDPKAIEAIGFITQTKKALNDVSMLPKEVTASYLNLSSDDCDVLKVSNLEQSIFESAYCKYSASDSKHEVLNHDLDNIYAIKLDRVNEMFEKKQTNESLNKEAEIINNFSSINRKRLVNGIHSIQSGRHLRKFVLIDENSEIEEAGDVEFIASSNLKQSHIQEREISQNDIVISSNYEKVLEQRKSILTITDSTGPTDSAELTVDDIPTESPYHLPNDCRYVTKLNFLAVLGYSLYENKNLTIPDNLTSYIKTSLSVVNKEAEAAAFFISPNPKGKMKDEYRNQTQFKELVKVHKEFYCNGKRRCKGQNNAESHIPNSFIKYGYSNEKCRYAVKLITPENKK